MKNLKSFLCLLVLYGTISFRATSQVAQPPTETSKITRQTLLVKWSFLPVIFESGFSGQLQTNNLEVSFTPAPCSGLQEKVPGLYPCNQFLINSIHIPWEEVLAVKRRNVLLIIPNRLLIKTRDNKRYRFVAWNRGRVINAFEAYQNERLGLNH